MMNVHAPSVALLLCAALRIRPVLKNTAVAHTATMDHDELIGEVQNRLELPSHGDAHKATRAVLTTLGERLQRGEATDLAAPLPDEIGRYLTEEPDQHEERFSFDTFIDRVAERADVDRSDATYYAQELMNIIHDAVPAGEIDDIRANLPEEYGDLFDLVGTDTRPTEQREQTDERRREPAESDEPGLLGRLLGYG